MQSYRGLPFATYDLAVYLPGGALLLQILLRIWDSFGGQVLIPSPLELDGGTVDSVMALLIWLSASYLAGHLGAFFSTYTVENFVHKVLGYPSEVWIQKEKWVSAGIEGNKALRRIFRDNIKIYRFSFSSVVVLLFQTPLLFQMIIFRIFMPCGFYAPKLPDNLMGDFKKRYALLRSSVPVGENTRWEKIVEHFVSNNCPQAYQRMYNYLVIYGALRIIAFIIIIYSWFIIIDDVSEKLAGNFSFSLSETFFYLLISSVGFMAMMAFAKFNRRYFEECILALLYAPSPLDSSES